MTLKTLIQRLSEESSEDQKNAEVIDIYAFEEGVLAELSSRDDILIKAIEYGDESRRF